MSRSWYDIWAARRLPDAYERGTASTLSALLSADGMDTGFGSVRESDWRAYVSAIAARLGIAAGDTVFEVGCGAGAFLLPLQERGCRVAGIDQSPALVALAGRFLPGGDFRVADAARIVDAAPVMHVVSMGVFMYFPDHDYAGIVLRGMAGKATRSVAILDIPDAAHRAEAVNMRRGHMTAGEYEEKYRGLEHRYYERDRIRQQLLAAGCSRVVIEDQCLGGYANAAFRFNAFGWR